MHTAQSLSRALRDQSDATIRRSQQRFFREPVRSLGVRTEAIRKLGGAAAREFRKKQLPPAKIFQIADRLWRGRVMEERTLAVTLLSRFERMLDRQHWRRLQDWIDSLSNWSETDHLCIDLLAPMLEREPGLVAELASWTASPHRWKRRAAAVALVPLARRGDRIEDAFQVCSLMMDDRDDMIEKAVGWLLKEASRQHPQAVARYLLLHKSLLSRATVRYACEKLPQRLRSRVLAA